VNAKVVRGGSLRAEALNATTLMPLVGFNMEHSVPFEGDESAHRFSWGESPHPVFSKLPEENIVFRFIMLDAWLYSITCL
jgi:hypothetical protein